MTTLLVFDLDFTLWDAGGTWCDHTRPPYRLRNGEVYDMNNSHIQLYPDVISLLAELQGRKFPLAIASKTGAPNWARDLLALFNIRRYFQYEEIYPQNKTHHFHQLQLKSNIDFANMIFFDDEPPNIREVGALGVTAIHVKEGITRQLVFEAMKIQH